MSQITRPTLQTEIGVNFADNNNKAITPALLRAFLADLIDSALITLTDGVPAGILITSGAPSNGFGANGNYAIDPVAKVIYGAKATNVWPSGSSFAGTPGTPGTNGVGVPAGGTTNQVLKKTSSTDYATAWADQTAFPDTPETVTVSANGTGSTARPAGVDNHLVNVNLAAGTYLYTLTADVGNSPTTGTRMRFVFNFAAGSSGAVLNLVLSGSLTIPVNNPSGLVGFATIDVQYVGSSTWVPTLQSDGVSADELRFTIADVTPGGKFLIQLEKTFKASSYGLVGDASGSIVLGIRKASTIGGLASIVASAPPTVSSAQSVRSSTLTGWNTDWFAGDFLEVSVISSSGSATQWSFAIGGSRS